MCISITYRLYYRLLTSGTVRACVIHMKWKNCDGNDINFQSISNDLKEVEMKSL